MMSILKYSIKIKNLEDRVDSVLEGAKAIQMVKDNISKNQMKRCDYHLILMDCNMPFKDGYSTSQDIREYIYSLKLKQPIISAITGHTE
jgi:CheY-like chemotaxis protein